MQRSIENLLPNLAYASDFAPNPRFITQCAGCYLPVICQWLCSERSFLFLISFSWTQYLMLNDQIYLTHDVCILLYIPHFSSILSNL